MVVDSTLRIWGREVKMWKGKKTKKKKKSKLNLPKKLILASAKYFQFRPYAKD